MRTLHKASVIFLAVASIMVLVRPVATFAATSPTLTGASTYSVVAGTTVTNTGATTISGNVGISPAGGGGYAESGTTTYGSGSALHNADGSAASAQSDNTATFSALSAVPNVACDTDYGAVTKELNGLSLLPGVYCANAFQLSGTLTLDDSGGSSGVWIFRSVLSTLITSAGIGAKVQFLTGAGLACNVWWKVSSSATIGSGTTMIGNILALTSISMGTGATLNGRAMAQTGAVTLDTNTISGPSCTAAVVAQAGSGTANINVVKVVVNDNGGTKTVSDFPLFLDGGSVKSGISYNMPVGVGGHVFTITETSNPAYARTFSGDCSSVGTLNANPGDNRFCVVTNNDIGAPVVIPPVPPLIDVVKVPSPLALPDGPGTVLYTYTLKNIGTVPVSNVTMVGDTCSPITRISGDTDNDNILDLTETWVHTCSTALLATHTNNVVATGWANGLSAVDIASATVVVGVPIIPPLIHVTKVPNPLALQAGGGLVTYTEKITNPGTVPLNNVTLVDDKCAPMRIISGDTNLDDKLDPTETWTFTCQSNLTQTTTNTAVATGTANGLTVRDFAIATVVVADIIPLLPNTGIFTNMPWLAAICVSFIMTIALLYIVRNKKNA